MKRVLTGLCAAAIAFAASSAVAATNIGVVNMEQIFKSSPQVKKINDDLRAKFAGKRTSLMAASKQLQVDVQTYTKNKSVMSKDKAKALSTKLAKEESSLRAQQTDFQKQLFQAQNTAMSAFMKQVDASVAKVAKSKGMTTVLPSNAVVYSQPGMDITASVQKAIS